MKKHMLCICTLLLLGTLLISCRPSDPEAQTKIPHDDTRVFTCGFEEESGAVFGGEGMGMKMFRTTDMAASGSASMQLTSQGAARVYASVDFAQPLDTLTVDLSLYRREDSGMPQFSFYSGKTELCAVNLTADGEIGYAIETLKDKVTLPLTDSFFPTDRWISMTIAVNAQTGAYEVYADGVLVYTGIGNGGGPADSFRIYFVSSYPNEGDAYLDDLTVWGAAYDCNGKDPGTILHMPEAPDNDPQLIGWFDYNTSLAGRDEFTIGTRKAICLSMAQNEFEGLQYIMTSDRAYSGLTCKLEDLSDGSGHTLSGTVYDAYDTQCYYMAFTDQEGLYRYSPGWYPDALPELTEKGFDITPGQSKTLYILYATTPDTVPGVYSGTLSICDGDKVIKAATVAVRVWDICYSEDTACRTLFGDMYGGIPIPGNLGMNHDKLYDFMLNYRINCYTLYIGDGSFECQVPYLDNPRVNSFCSPNSALALENYKGNTEWADKTFCYTYDEPTSEDVLKEIYTFGQEYQNTYPGFHFIVPYSTIHEFEMDGKTVDTFDILSVASDINCPYMWLFRGDLAERYAKLKQETGHEVWWYVTNDITVKRQFPTDIPQNDALPAPGIESRTLFWLQYENNVDGFLYWCVNDWLGMGNIWNYSEAVPEENYSLNGHDGLLVYWDPETYDPISTMQLEATRDGIEDFQLLKMAEELLGRDETVKYAQYLTTDIDTYILNSNSLLTAREALALRVSNAIKSADFAS